GIRGIARNYPFPWSETGSPPCSRGRSSRSHADRCCARTSHRSPGSPVAGNQYRERSSQALLLSAGDPGAELLAGLALLIDVLHVADHAVADVLGGLVCG